MKGLQCRGVTAARRARAVVREFTATLPPGTVCALLGANGAGKSTLLEALAGGGTLAAGQVCLDGIALPRYSARELAKLRAYLPQRHDLNFPLRVAQVVLLGRAPHGSGGGRDRAIVTAALAAVDAEALVDRTYTELSGGERQRVQLARVLAQVWEAGAEAGTRVLLLDEPTAGLDLGHQQMLLRQLRLWASGGGVVVAALHDLNLALRYSDRVWALQGGRLVADDRPAAVIDAEFVRALVGADTRVERGCEGLSINILE